MCHNPWCLKKEKDWVLRFAMAGLVGLVAVCASIVSQIGFRLRIGCKIHTWKHFQNTWKKPLFACHAGRMVP
jgi:hypothetical protein